MEEKHMSNIHANFRVTEVARIDRYVENGPPVYRIKFEIETGNADGKNNAYPTDSGFPFGAIEIGGSEAAQMLGDARIGSSYRVTFTPVLSEDHE